MTQAQRLPVALRGPMRMGPGGGEEDRVVLGVHLRALPRRDAVAREAVAGHARRRIWRLEDGDA
eukprot:CAMPEP_0115284996 /NCGR_PEP_ID=MMETSP0270-20121206/61196_1 /TAXON_ID=71861 /ORGANISM="Scrippsiella trochoidea, Strain CCMP3099" /LENGTH=63 /DNA_ID=CAMNT_0002701991 /DNA_START=412 /DNA_END=604 /DNA_ORIENTATION=+